MALTRIHTFVDGEVVTAANLNGELDNIVTKINGNIGDTEINTGDPITLGKLVASYAFATVSGRFVLATGWPAATDFLEYFTPFPISAGEVWYPVKAAWMCDNCGHAAGATGTFNISFGYLNNNVAPPTWNSTQLITSAATAITTPALDHSGGQGLSTINTGVALTNDAQTRGFIIRTVAADANAMNVAGDVFSWTILLKRQIIA